MIKTIQIDDLKCECVPNPASRRVVYMIYPAVKGFTEAWLQKQAEENDCSLVMIYVSGDNWDDYLTPWPAPGVPKGSAPFKGLASDFNQTLLTMVIPEAEKAVGLSEVAERDLAGVSLSGLFTLWQWMQYGTFRSIACLSGSFWYEGFVEWFEKQTIPHKSGKAFFLLGTDEPKSKVKAFRPVGANTETIVSRLKSSGIPVTFDWVPGDHFANPIPRAEVALVALREG